MSARTDIYGTIKRGDDIQMFIGAAVDVTIYQPPACVWRPVIHLSSPKKLRPCNLYDEIIQRISL